MVPSIPTENIGKPEAFLCFQQVSKETSDMKWVNSYSWCRSSHWRCSVKKGVLRDFGNFAGKYLCESLFIGLQL